MNDTNKTGVIIAVLIVVALVIGLWVWIMNSNDETNQTNTEPTTSEQEQVNQQTQQDIVDTAMTNESLSTLVSAVQAADLVDTLKGEGPFTVFAPSNTAFDKLPEGTLDELLLPENKEQLAALLQYHVVSGSVMSSSLQDGQNIETLNGGTLTVSIEDESVYLVDATGGRAMVMTPDVPASNGVVHIIDTVVMPE